MENPIKRLRRERGLSQKGLADALDMSTHGLLRYEQGLYEHLSPKILEWIGENTNDRAYEECAYQEFRKHQQWIASQWVDNLPPIQINAEAHPFVTFREHITTRAVGTKSRIRFCILLAVNPAVVLNYDKGKQGPMPSLIKEALTNAGVDPEYLHRLDVYGQIWHERYGC